VPADAGETSGYRDAAGILMRLVFLTQAVDVDDPILGATVAKLRSLASRVEELHVVCDRVGRHDLPGNVSLATWAAPTRIGRGARMLRALVPLLVRRRPDAVIAHMCPIYLVLAAPFAKPLGARLGIWYTHWTIDRTLRLATALCDVALSVDVRSYPLESSKVVAIGHGIDVAEFTPRGSAPNGDPPLQLVALGRTSPSKGFTTLLQALELGAEHGLDATLEVYGPSSTDEERRYREELTRIAARPALTRRVRIEPPIPRGDVPELLRRFDAVVNTTRGQTHGGALDKAVYEAAACAVPVMACNPHFDHFLGGLPLELRFRSADPEDLSRVLTSYAASSSEERTATGNELRRRVEAGHSTETWADGLVRAIGDLGR
jgi:glycosyltransferase involved in cell wall biosynthesis